MKFYTHLLILLIVLFSSQLSWSQQHLNTAHGLDTIYANETKNVALFFPDPIHQATTGTENFVFTFNREKEQYFGLLQATKGENSNLLVITKNGSIFSYIIGYKKGINQVNYFIDNNNSIGNVDPSINNTKDTATTKPVMPLENSDYKLFCNSLLRRNQHLGNIKKRKGGIILKVDNIVFKDEQIYFVIKIENKSNLDYDLNFLNFYLTTRKKGKRKSLQRIYRPSLYVHQLPNKVKAGDQIRTVYVMPKYSLSNDRSMMLELNENHGERIVKLKISHRFINNPN